MSAFKSSTTIERIRARLDHPVIDGDGHQLECMPMVLSILKDLAGKDIADRLVESESTDWPRGTRPTPAGPRVRSFYGLLTETPSIALPQPFPEAARQPHGALGFDLTHCSTRLSLCLFLHGLIRRGPDSDRARVQIYTVPQVYDGFRDRLEPVEVIPMVTPEEAVAELEYAVTELGLKAVMLKSAPGALDHNRGWRQRRLPSTHLVSGVPTIMIPLWKKCRASFRSLPFSTGSATGWGPRGAPKPTMSTTT